MLKPMCRLASAIVFSLAAGAATAWAQMPNPYGAPIALDTAKKAAAAAIAEASKNKWNMAVAVTDTGGNLVYFERMDNTQHGSINVAIGKARSAALFKRPGKAFEQAVASGGAGLRILGLEGAVPLDGGFPLVVDGKIVGAIGVSGATGDQDAQCAKAGVDAVK
jgi:uncharacterized protein GlcG (DUF336 family)